jgi:endonuclease/exonuclease/phosphatase family metal-dependent hydrolase
VANVFSAMTWNVENLFRPPSDAAAEVRDRYKRKLLLLKRVIEGASPDVVGLQEVGGDDALADLQEALGGRYPHRAASNAPDRRGIRVAFLSKLPIAARTDVVEFPPGPALDVKELDGNGAAVPVKRMGRGALGIRVTTCGTAIELVAAHLKSKLLTFPRPRGESSFQPRDEAERAQVAGIALLRRTAEAVTLRLRANALLAGDAPPPLVLLGDFNDVPEAQSSLILTGPPGSEIGTAGFSREDKGDRWRLFNLGARIDEARRYSRVFRGRRELIDHVYVSQALLPRGADGKRVLPEVDSLVDFAGSLASISEDPGERVKEVAPDHAPVIARFDLDAARG